MKVNEETQKRKTLEWLCDSSYVPVDFHFGGQHTSLTEDEAGGFGLWTRRLDLHGYTQPASCYLHPSCWTNPASPSPLSSPLLPAFHFLSSPVSGSPPAASPSVGSQGNLAGFSPSLPNSFLHHPRQRASQPVPPPASHLLCSKPPYKGDSFLIHMCDVSESASERGSREDSRPAVFLPWQQHQPANAVQSWLRAAVATAGVSRQQAPAPPQPSCSCTLWAPWRRLLASCLGEITAVVSHSSAQLSSGRVQEGMGGLLLFYCSVTFLSLAWLPVLHRSHTFCLSLDLSLFHLPVAPSPPPSQLHALLLSVWLSTHSHSFYF